MAVTTTNDPSKLGARLARYGAGAAIAAGAVAVILFARNERGKEKMAEMFGAQFGNLDEQLQVAIRENLPLIEEAIDRLIETLQQGVSTLSEEINRLGGEAKNRLSEYATVIPEQIEGANHAS